MICDGENGTANGLEVQSCWVSAVGKGNSLAVLPPLQLDQLPLFVLVPPLQLGQPDAVLHLHGINRLQRGLGEHLQGGNKSGAVRNSVSFIS